MWKLKQLIPGGDEEEREESFLEDESDGLCSLSYTQVLLSAFPTILFQFPSLFSFIYLLSIIENHFFDSYLMRDSSKTENVCFRCVFASWSGLYVPGMCILCRVCYCLSFM